ncbi:MAG: hypothetical protein Nk1A_1710 [Endomicrobiia bacterium]|nr:MAG: hypothetical protein Nk1A_1710 [Endomicrobiia bacterium]
MEQTRGVCKESMIEGNKIYVDDNYIGQNIAYVKLRRKDNHTVTVKREDYKTKTVSIDY